MRDLDFGADRTGGKARHRQCRAVDSRGSNAAGRDNEPSDRSGESADVAAEPDTESDDYSDTGIDFPERHSEHDDTEFHLEP